MERFHHRLPQNRRRLLRLHLCSIIRPRVYTNFPDESLWAVPVCMVKEPLGIVHSPHMIHQDRSAAAQTLLPQFLRIGSISTNVCDRKAFVLPDSKRSAPCLNLSSTTHIVPKQPQQLEEPLFQQRLGENLDARPLYLILGTNPYLLSGEFVHIAAGPKEKPPNGSSSAPNVSTCTIARTAR